MTNATAIIADRLGLSVEALILAMIKPASSLRISDQNRRTMNFITTSSFYEGGSKLIGYQFLYLLVCFFSQNKV